MKCDLCGRETDKNYFDDAWTIFCADCAKSSGMLGGARARDFIAEQANPPKQDFDFVVKNNVQHYLDGIITAQELAENIATLHNNKNKTLENILNSALQREITTEIGHQPDKDEMRVCVDYIKNYAQTSEQVDLTGVCIAIMQARKECFKQCEDCGDYYLAKDMNTEYGYCLTCKPHCPEK